MQPRHRVSRAAIDLIKAFEGYRAKAARLADGRWTIGYGHTLTARQGAQVSESDAEALLIYDLIAVAHAVNEWTYAPLTQNQFDALTAFAFNIGLDRFRASSVLRLVNEGQLLHAACAMELWRKAQFEGAPIVVDALVRRRSAEKTLFLTPPGGWVPAPSPVLPPDLDLDASGTAPSQEPTELTAPLDGALAVAELAEGATPPPTATQRAAAEVAARLQTIFPDEAPAPEPAPIAPPPQPEAAASNDRPKFRMDGEPLDTATEQKPLPPPDWPLTFGADRGFVLTPPTEQDFDEAGVSRVEPAMPVPANESEPTLFEAPIAGGQATEAQPLPETHPPEPATDARVVLEIVQELPRPPSELMNWAPLTGLAATGIAFFVGGLMWSANAHEGEGVLNPWIVGTLACLAGVGFMSIALYLLLARLGHVPGPDDGGRDAG